MASAGSLYGLACLQCSLKPVILRRWRQTEWRKCRSIVGTTYKPPKPIPATRPVFSTRYGLALLLLLSMAQAHPKTPATPRGTVRTTMNIAENDRTWRMITVSISTIITGNTVQNGQSACYRMMPFLASVKRAPHRWESKSGYRQVTCGRHRRESQLTQ
jgi:hypothetical protein